MWPRNRLAVASLLASGAKMTEISLAAGLPNLKDQKPGPRLPVLFVGHGSPMNAVHDNEYRRSWESLGRDFGARLPQPQLILCISARSRSWPIRATTRTCPRVMPRRSAVWG